MNYIMIHKFEGLEIIGFTKFKWQHIIYQYIRDWNKWYFYQLVGEMLYYNQQIALGVKIIHEPWYLVCENDHKFTHYT